MDGLSSLVVRARLETAFIRKRNRPVGSGVWRAYVVGRDAVHLIPSISWCIATWVYSTPGYSIAVDICTPPTLVGSEWTYIDLELDPYRRSNGDVGTDDWAEFLGACAVGAISPDEETEPGRPRRTWSAG